MEPERKMQEEQEVEAKRWENIPTWKRKVLQRKETEVICLYLRQLLTIYC